MDSIPKFLGNYNIMDDLQGCTSCSKRQFLNKRHLYQDITYSTMKAEKGQSLQTNECSANYTPLTHLRRWRTFINNTFARYINCILYFLILLSRLLYDFKSYKRTFLKSILLLYGLMVLVNPSTSEQVYFSPRQDTKLTDTIVPVGAHFVYKIPYSLFDCDVDRLEISEGSTRSLPYWLAFSEARQELYGVASIKDTGSYDILVVAVTNSTSGTGQICAIKAFSITVSTRDSSSQINNNYPLSSVTMETPSTRSEGSHFQCSAGTQAFFGTVLISANMHQLTGHQRMMVLASMADYLNVSSSKVALFTADNGHPMLSHLEQLSVLTSGAGDGRFKSGSKSILTWILSCGAIRLGDSYLHELENKAKDGTMSEKLGYPIVGWHVTSGVQKSKHRARRAAAATPTPQATSILPTRVMSSSTIIINETSSLSSSSSVFNNSTILPQTTSYVTPTSSVLPSSSTLEHSWSVSSMIATSPVSNITSTPILTTFVPTIGPLQDLVTCLDTA